MLNASEKVIFHVNSRDLTKGEHKVSLLRKQDKVPGNIYGLSEESQAVYMDYQAINKLFESQGDTGLVYLQVGENKTQVPVLIDVLDYSGVDNKILHVSFKRVSLKQKIQADVSVSLVGEVKIDNSIVATLNDTVSVEALPADLPENFEIDISELTEVGQTITVADLKIDRNKVAFILGEDEKPEDLVIVMIQGVKEIVEPEEDETPEGEEADAETTDEATENTEEKSGETTESEDKKD